MLHAIPALSEMATDKLSNDHLQVLQTVTRNLREERCRIDVGEEVLGKLCAVLSRLSTKSQRLSIETEPEEVTSLSLRLTADCFRALRNACVQCTVNQRCLRDLGSIELCFEILRNLLQLSSRRSEDGTEALRCGIQFLGNIAVGNQLCKEDIWKLGFPHIFWDLLQESDKKTIAYTCMVLHTCLDAHKTEHLARDTKQFLLSLKIIDLCRMLPDVEWTVLIATQHVLKSAILVKRLYTEMTDDGRLTLLELLLERFSDVEEEKDTVAPPDVAHFLACCFSDHCRDVLALTSESSGDAQAPGVVFRLLDVLCEMTSDCKAFMVLQDHPDLLSTTVGLLKEVHLLGKASRNVFTAAHNFSTGPGGSDTHPALSFKAHLIRLIGNLCYEHIANQDKVRELDGIALILDNCSIDSNNPFISQWAVFAIRNLLEHNLENQKLIQGLQRRGVADDSLLRDMGFRVEERDGSLLLRPVKKDP